MRIATLAALAAAFALVCPRAALATNYFDATRATVSKQTPTSTTTCASGGLVVQAYGAGSASIDVRGTFTATMKVQTSADGTNWSSDLTIYPASGAGVTSITAAGTWTLPILSQQLLCAYVSAYTSSPTIIVNTSPAVGDVAVQGMGTAGTPVGGVVSVQGVTSGQALPVSGTVTATVAGATLAPNGIGVLETPAAASPVACTAANVAVLNAVTSRSTAGFQGIGTVDICLCYGLTCPAPSASGCGTTGVVLKAATSAGKGDGGQWGIGNQAGKIWNGAISCGGSAGGLLSAVAY